MEETEPKEKIIEAIQKSKLKSITLEEIYQASRTIYSPEMAKQTEKIIQELIQEKRIEPLKNAKKNSIGIPLKYRIIKEKKDDRNSQQEIMKLHKKIEIQYFLKHPDEYEKWKMEIEAIHNFLKGSSKGERITVNERSYQLFKDEKKLKQNENLLKKLGIEWKDLNCYETYEPFFYFENTKYQQKNKKILILENRDTFWSFQRRAQKDNSFYLIIYGEGKKILNSFDYIQNFNLPKKSEILYFGDIDYEGINIYLALAQKYETYHIVPYLEAYHKMLTLEDKPRKVKNKQNKREENITRFLEYFQAEDRNKLEKLFKNELYIPQEIINYEEVEKLK